VLSAAQLSAKADDLLAATRRKERTDG
jgi:hypothetical protein